MVESWKLARIERGPVAAPKKQLWEHALGTPAAVQAAIKDRLVGWPTWWGDLPGGVTGLVVASLAGVTGPVGWVARWAASPDGCD